MAGAQINVMMTEEEKRQFRIEAAKRDVSMSDLGSQLLNDWLDEHADNSE